MWLALQLACAPDEVLISGTVYAGPSTATLAAEGSVVRIRDASADLYAEGSVDSEGAFALAAPKGGEIFAEIAAPNVPVAVFAGYAGLDDFKAEPGSLFSSEDLVAWSEPFAGCPGLATGSAVFGEVVFADLRDPESGLAVPASGALVNVAVDHEEDRLVSACFLNDEGTAYLEGATVAGATGRFVVAGLPAGFHELRVGFQAVESGFDFTFWEVWLPEDGISPWFPAEIAFLE